MAQGSIARLDRSAKAAGICNAQECTPVDDLPGLWHVRDSGTGSGRIHVTSAGRCDCPDYNYRGNVCKHMRAVSQAEAELAAYAANWDAQAKPCCPMCGGELAIRNCYVGGRGYTLFEVCAGDGSHYTKRV